MKSDQKGVKRNDGDELLNVETVREPLKLEGRVTPPDGTDGKHRSTQKNIENATLAEGKKCDWTNALRTEISRWLWNQVKRTGEFEYDIKTDFHPII